MLTESEECKAGIGDHLDGFARKARSRAGERISNRSGARIVPEHRYSVKRNHTDLGITMQIVIDHDDDDD